MVFKSSLDRIVGDLAINISAAAPAAKLEVKSGCNAGW